MIGGGGARTLLLVVGASLAPGGDRPAPGRVCGDGGDGNAYSLHAREEAVVPRILLILSASDHWTLKDGTSHPTGFWAEEVVVPHRTFRDRGVDVRLGTPGGRRPTVDAASLSP